MDEYAIGGGRLKLKGGPVMEGRVEKRMKKKEKREKKEKEKKEGEGEGEGGERTRTEKKMDTEANVNRNGDGDGDGNTNKDGGQQQHNGSKGEEGVDSVTKTQAERRYEAMKKRRLELRLQREGAKTHKERVQDFNRYLSTLSEHHDMPRIGPG